MVAPCQTWMLSALLVGCAVVDSQKAADELEELVPVLKQIIQDLRSKKSYPYARVYWFRWKVGAIVRALGDYGRELPIGISAVKEEYKEYGEYR